MVIINTLRVTAVVANVIQNCIIHWENEIHLSRKQNILYINKLLLLILLLRVGSC